MSPYLFSSHRWPALPRESDAAVIFCHGPFLPEDYAIAQKLLEKSSLVISLCSVHRDEHRVLVSPPLPQSPDRTAIKKSKSSLNLPFQRTVLRRIRSAQDKLKEMNDTVQDKLKEANEKARELPNQTRRRMESAYQSSSVTSRIASAFKSQSLGPQYISPSPHHSPKLDLTPPSTKFFDPDTYAPYNETKPATGADSPFHSPSLRPQYDSPNTQSSPTFEYPHVHQPHRVQTMPPPYSQAHNTEPGTTTNHLAAPHPPLPHRMNTSPGQLEHTEVGLAAERRMVILLLGIKPHRGSVWASSERPEESVLRYQLFNGCPAIVLPMRSGGPLLGWHTMTLQGLHDAWYRDGGGFGSTSARQRTTEIDRITQTLFMFVDQCINWERVNPDEETEFRLYEEEDEEAIWVNKRLAVARALELLVVAAAQSDSMELRRNVDRARTGIAFFRLP
ncbi:hypothetical protein BKA62DRAFT_729456 [Auriculariales sp. MPI-PUGE-AT-0066]|nr:hypothetical protein BKA62DRAFT_729456 [Auriculariales sp. MPI-PUGE-AT-0066]